MTAVSMPTTSLATAALRKQLERLRRKPRPGEPRTDSRRGSERRLEPWLGPGLSRDDLPVPRMIAIRVARGAAVDTAALRQALAREVVGASLDDHRGWIDRMRRMASTAIAGGL